jgi:DNA polymerase I-like protein with 3'-5' exonuclease and polymerase domains
MCASKHSLSPWQSRITVIGVTWDGGSQVFRDKLWHSAVNQARIFIEQDADYEIEGQGFKFDWLHLAVHGWEIPLERWVDCTALMAYTLTDKVPDSFIMELKRRAPPHVSHRFGKHSLKVTAPYYLGVEPFWEVDDKDNDEYVLTDSEYSRQLRIDLEARLKERGEYEFYKESLLPWTKMLLRAEYRGIKVDMDGLAAMEGELQAKAEQLRAKLDEQWADAHLRYRSQALEELSQRYEAMAAKANKPFNYGSRYWMLYEKARSKAPTGVDYDSPKQMAWLLRDFLGYDIHSLEGEESTGREVLERLAEEGKEDVKTYLEWRKTNKILTAFIPTYKELATDGVLHPIFNPDVTRTGRTSSERPNCQQVPPALRPLFVARPGYKLVGYDAAAIEAKLIAAYSEDPTLFEIIKQGVSIHDHNVKVFFNYDTPYDEVKKKHPNERAAAKNVGFALFYNAGPNRIRIAFAQKGYHLTQEECKRLHERFKRSYQTAYKYGREVVAYLEQGEVLLNLLGRPIRIENAEDAYMQSFNTIIQSSASDLLLEGAHRADKKFQELGIDAHPLLFVHDYVCFEVADEHVPEADAILQKSLTDFELKTRHGRVLLEVDGGVSARWEK